MIPINDKIIEQETQDLLRGIASYRRRLVFRTLKAAPDFHAGVFGFQHFITDFVQSLQPQIGIDMTDILSINNHTLRDQAARIFVGQDHHSHIEVQELCAATYKNAPYPDARNFPIMVAAARKALGDYFRASQLVFAADMEHKGASHGRDIFDDLLEGMSGMFVSAQQARPETRRLKMA